MYEDPIPQYPSLNHHSHQYNNNHGHAVNDNHDTREQSSDPADQQLQRLHQHQLLIQLRLEVNSLRTQIQQLELLKQQLVLQRQMMQPAEYEQLMDQFSRTLASLLSVRQPSHGFNDSSPSGEEHATDGSGGTGERMCGMPMMEKLQERLRSLTIQQNYQHQQQQQFHHHYYQHSMEMDHGGESNHSNSRRDPVRMEQTSLEADLRDLEKRMRSIQLLC